MAAFTELRERHGNPAVARVQRPVGGHELGVLSVLFHGPVYGPRLFGKPHMRSSRSFHLEVHRSDDELSDDLIYEEAGDGWAEMLVILKAGRYPDETGGWLHLDWLSGEDRRTAVAAMLGGFPTRIRNRPNDLG